MVSTEEGRMKKLSCLTNSDFRQMLKSNRNRDPRGLTKLPTDENHFTSKRQSRRERTEKRRQKKKAYAEACKAGDVMARLAKKYRDRAQERREGKNPDYLNTGIGDPLLEPAAYHAVGHDPKFCQQLAARRRILIQQSKYLGGDMAHTHLVKGLDYALLHKVQSEIEAKNKEINGECLKEDRADQETSEAMPEMKSTMAKNIYYTAVVEMNKPIERNPMFAPGRMCYAVDITEENLDTDIPRTIIRSLAEVPEKKNLCEVADDDVLNSVIAVLRAVREGGKYKRKKKVPEAGPEINLCSDVKETENVTKKQKKEKRERKAVTEIDKCSAEERILKRLTSEPLCYEECYPGLEDMQEDSDDQADYTMMDMGTRKGTLGKWDFDEENDYFEYMTRREAMPKAAFQFGLKKSAGRKTRKFFEKNAKESIDKEWKEIKKRIESFAR